MEIKATVHREKLLNLRLAIIGKLAGMNRKEARRLVKQQGGILVDQIVPPLDLLVVGDGVATKENADFESPEISKLIDDGSIEVMSEAKFWQNLGLMDDDYPNCRMYTPAMLAELLKIPVATVRRWHRRGLIQPVQKIHKLPFFDYQQVSVAKQISELLTNGNSAKSIESKLAKWVELSPVGKHPLTQLTLIADGKNLLLRSNKSLIESGGQKRLDFEGLNEPIDDERANVFSFEPAAVNRELGQLKTRDDFLYLAMEFEDADETESACEVYRSLLLAFGPSADICFRLAENLFQMGDLNGARERYYSAIELDEEFVEARASLGCLLVEQSKFELARSAFEGALEYYPDYTDVIFHLARLLDSVGETDQAVEYWERFLSLAPKSPWADEARSRLQQV